MFSASSLFLLVLSAATPCPERGVLAVCHRAGTMASVVGGCCRASWTRTGRPQPRLCTCTGRAKPPIWIHTPRSRLARSWPLESQTYSSQIEPPDTPHEPILTLPGALTAYVALIAAIHLRVLLPVELENWTIDVFGFIPKRYDSTLLNITFPGGAGAKVWTFVTYSLLHANLSHIGFNVLWLLPFGSALARRFGPVRFFAFMAVTAAAGALAHLVTHEHAIAPMIGASASVSGAMAAAIRFAFVTGSFLSFSRGDADEAARVPALSLWRALQNPRVLAFLAIWFGVNIVFGLGSISVGSEGASVAWQAHIGGFIAGLMLFSLFDPLRRTATHAADASSRDI